MEQLEQLLLEYGCLGMFAASFLAGTVVPFASEAVLVAFVRLGTDPLATLLFATAGNTAGSMTCYWIGMLGKQEWIERYMRVKPETMRRAERFLGGRGAWMGFFSFLPVIGNALTIALGLMRANVPVTTISIAIGAFVRYAACLAATNGIVSLFSSL